MQTETEYEPCNKQNVDRLIGLLIKLSNRYPPDAVMKYDQSRFLTWIDNDGECGTVGCIAGWSCYLAMNRDPEAARMHWFDQIKTAKQWLGITQPMSIILFDPCPRALQGEGDDVKIHHAIDALVRLRDGIEAGDTPWGA